AAAEVEGDQQVAGAPVERLRPRGGQVRLSQLVDLEVHVRRAQDVRPLPGQVEVVAVAGELAADVEAGQVALLRRDGTRHDRDVGVVLLRALPEGVVGGAAGQVYSGHP